MSDALCFHGLFGQEMIYFDRFQYQGSWKCMISGVYEQFYSCYSVTISNKFWVIPYIKRRF